MKYASRWAWTFGLGMLAACSDDAHGGPDAPSDALDGASADAGPADGSAEYDADPPPFWLFDAGPGDAAADAELTPREPFTELATCDGGCAPSSLTANGQMTCSVAGDGVTQCWGQIANAGARVRVDHVNAPAVSASPTGTSACYVSVLGELWCSGWGKTARLSRIADVRAIAANDSELCAVRAGGVLTCVALDGYGLPVEALDGAPREGTEGLTIASVSLAARHGCALDTDGALYCWGEDDDGALAGQGDLDKPTRIADGPFAQVTTGEGATCTRAAAGEVACWGARYAADGAAASQATVYTLPAPASSVQLGNAHACALLTDGGVWCWGDGYDGQLGQPTLQTSRAPVQVQLSGSTKALATGAYHTCVIDALDDVRCWGSDANYAVRGREHARASTLRQPRAFDGMARYSELTLGAGYGCLLDTDRALSCWGSPLVYGDTPPLDLPSEHPALVSAERYTRVVSGEDIGCALREGGTLWCWGHAGVGYYSDGFRERALNAVHPELSFSAFAMNRSNGCGVTSAGALSCWGTSGIAGSGTSPYGAVTLLPATRFTDVALATDRGVAIDSAGRLFGFMTAGSVGPPTPTQISASATFRQVRAGTTHFCALDANGGLWCWGTGTSGTLGLGEGVSSAAAPTRVGSATGYRQLAIRDGNSCVIASDDEVLCFGPNTALGPSYTPTAMLPGRRVQRIAPGPQRSLCALDMEGQLACIGETAQLYAQRFGNEVLLPSEPASY